MKVYLAGPDVFRPDAPAWAAMARQLAAARGHEALVPLDNDETTAAAIYAANIGLIRRADAVLARLDPFRGFEPDSGTVFECGFALALGKPVVGYVADIRPLAHRLAACTPGGLSAGPGRLIDADGLTVEQFGLPLNLMLAVPCHVVQGGLAEALDRLDAVVAVAGGGR